MLTILKGFTQINVQIPQHSDCVPRIEKSQQFVSNNILNVCTVLKKDAKLCTFLTLNRLLTTKMPFANSLDSEKTPSNSPRSTLFDTRTTFNQLCATLKHFEN